MSWLQISHSGNSESQRRYKFISVSSPLMLLIFCQRCSMNSPVTLPLNIPVYVFEGTICFLVHWTIFIPVTCIHVKLTTHVRDLVCSDRILILYCGTSDSNHNLIHLVIPTCVADSLILRR